MANFSLTENDPAVVDQGIERSIKGQVKTYTDANKPTPAVHGVGPIWIDGVEYWSNGTTFNRAAGIGNTLVIVGDSFDVRSEEFTSGTDTSISAYGIWNLTNMLMANRFNVLNIDAVSGSGALAGTTYASRMQAGAYDFNPRFVSIRCSVNDFIADHTYADLVAEYTRLFSEINSNNSTIITNTVGPTNFYTTTAQRSIWQKFNMWLLNTAPTLFDIIVLPQHYQTSDPAVLTGGIDSSYSSDGTHPDLNGAFLVAQSSADNLSKYLDVKAPVASPGIAQISLGTDDETAIDENPINVGTGGTLGSNVTGVVSDDYGVRTTGSLGNVVASKVPRTDGPGEWQQVVWTPSAAHQLLEFHNTGGARLLNAGFAVGDIVQLLCEVEVDSSTADADAHYPIIKITWSGVTGTVSTYGFNSSFPALGKSGWHGTVATPKIAIPVGATGLFISLGFMNKTVGAQTIRFGQHSLINHSTTLALS